MIRRLRHKIERTFLAGLVVTVPTVLVFFLLKLFVNYIDRISKPFVEHLFHVDIPGIGLVVTLLMIFFIGLFSTNFVGRKFVALGESLVKKIPLVRSVYASVKQIIELFFSPKDKPFQQVVLVPYPHDGSYALGVVTGKAASGSPATAFTEHHQGTVAENDRLVNIFIPSTPNFTGGLLIIYPQSQVIPLSMSVEEGFKYLMSGGMLLPEKPPEAPETLEEWDLFLH
ncbi:hypothetical protein U14_05647 [Candidatus Moduliflexus flocculans]|uniref:Transporter n=1 Tax=Candidatus Moduliflexus flocculans TaxID=1499966 RepID=A0A081BSI1_9BACT|nr:hypothetical protein U14_05647 [Candidatus Moduliflexus flocculans]